MHTLYPKHLKLYANKKCPRCQGRGLVRTPSSASWDGLRSITRHCYCVADRIFGVTFEYFKRPEPEDIPF